MLKKLLACFVFLLVMVSSAAFGEMGLYTAHYSIAGLTNGQSDYSDARFLEFRLEVVDMSFDSVATEEDVKRSGTITVEGGNYSFWNGKEMQKVSGTQETFNLEFESWSGVGENVGYMLVMDNGEEFSCGVEADNGLNGVSASWNFPDKPSFNGRGVVPNYKTTREQLNTFVPYVEYIRSGSSVTGIKWRVVNPSDTSKPLSQDVGMTFSVNHVYDAYRNSLYSGPWDFIEPGKTPEGTVMFDEPIDESEIYVIRVYLNYEIDGKETTNLWYFSRNVKPETWLWQNHVNEASLVNGKSDYRDAKFAHLFFDIQADKGIVAEAKHFTNEGRMTIPGGGYTLADDDNGEELGISVEKGTDKTYALRMNDGLTLDDSYLEYLPVDENGIKLCFSGGAETGLNGRTITWIFPDELNLNGSESVNKFRSTAEQLAQGVPYAEVVSADGKITAINYRLVTSQNTSGIVNPSYRTDFRIYVERIKGGRYRSRWQNDTASGTWTLPEPQEVSNMRYIIIRLRTHEGTSSPSIYQWEFYPASEETPEPEPTPKTPSSSGGGCSAGFTLAGLALIAILIRKH